MESLLELFDRYVGRKLRQLRVGLAEASCPQFHGPKFDFIQGMLVRFYMPGKSAVNQRPEAVRREVFLLAEKFRNGPSNAEWKRGVFERAGRLLQMAPEEIEQALLADMEDERILERPKEPLDGETLRLKANSAIVQGFLARSQTVRIRACGQVRPLIRQAKWQGLICTIHGAPASPEVIIQLSGPLSILRRTLVYGRALAGIVPFLALADEFVLEALIPMEGHERTVTVRKGDPIFPKEEVRKFDSKLEKKFSEQFLRATDDWDLIREPRPLRSGGGLIFPDFAIRHRTNLDLIWYLEIIGFWTTDYLKKKIASYQNLKIDRLILCLSQIHEWPDDALPVGAKTLRFKTRIDPKAVLQIIDFTPN